MNDQILMASVVLLVNREAWDAEPKNLFEYVERMYTTTFPGVVKYEGVRSWDSEDSAARKLYEWIAENPESALLRVCFDEDPTNDDADAGCWDCPIGIRRETTTALVLEKPERWEETIAGHLFTERKYSNGDMQSDNLGVELSESVNADSVHCTARLNYDTSVKSGVGNSKQAAFADLISEMKASRDRLDARIRRMENPST